MAALLNNAIDQQKIKKKKKKKPKGAKIRPEHIFEDLSQFEQDKLVAIYRRVSRYTVDGPAYWWKCCHANMDHTLYRQCGTSVYVKNLCPIIDNKEPIVSDSMATYFSQPLPWTDLTVEQQRYMVNKYFRCRKHWKCCGSGTIGHTGPRASKCICIKNAAKINITDYQLRWE